MTGVGIGHASTRLWAGRTTAERQADRRRRLLEAGISLVAAGGGQAVTVRSVCRRAGLTSRYFYEEFADRDGFAVEVFRSVAAECQAAIRDAVGHATTAGEIAAAAVDAVLRLAVDEPDKGRLLFVAPNTDPGLFATRTGSLPIVGEMIAAQIAGRASRASRSLKSASLVGALSHDLSLYVGGTLEVSREAFTEHCVALLLAVVAM